MEKPTQFSESQTQQAYYDGIEKNFWHTARCSIVTSLCSRYRAEPFLEIGAGRGYMPNAFLEAGWSGTGIELSSEMMPYKAGLPIRYGTDAFDLEEKQRYIIRSIGLFDVIQHLPDRVFFLAQLRSYFPNLEYLYITVPACMSLWTNYDEFYGHFLRYNPRILRKELNDAGYEVVKLRHFFHALYIPIWLKARVGSARTVAYTPPTGLVALLHRLIGSYFIWEAAFVPGWVPGSSLVCIAKRK